jgi:hypothetical protein
MTPCATAGPAMWTSSPTSIYRFYPHLPPFLKQSRFTDVLLPPHGGDVSLINLHAERFSKVQR